MTCWLSQHGDSGVAGGPGIADGAQPADDLHHLPACGVRMAGGSESLAVGDGVVQETVLGLVERERFQLVQEMVEQARAGASAEQVLIVAGVNNQHAGFDGGGAGGSDGLGYRNGSVPLDVADVDEADSQRLGDGPLSHLSNVMLNG